MNYKGQGSGVCRGWGGRGQVIARALAGKASGHLNAHALRLGRAAGAQAHLVAPPIAHLLGREPAGFLHLGELQAGGLERLDPGVLLLFVECFLPEAYLRVILLPVSSLTVTFSGAAAAFTVFAAATAAAVAASCAAAAAFSVAFVYWLAVPASALICAASRPFCTWRRALRRKASSD